MTTPTTERRSWVPELTFAARLALVRHQMGWNIKEAALACDQPPQSWRGWEVEGRLPQDIVDVVRQISDKTGVERDWLLFGGPLAEAAAGRQLRSIRRSRTRTDKATYRPRTPRTRPPGYPERAGRPVLLRDPLRVR